MLHRQGRPPPENKRIMTIYSEESISVFQINEYKSHLKKNNNIEKSAIAQHRADKDTPYNVSKPKYWRKND